MLHSVHSIHLAPGSEKAWGWSSPTQSPKVLCCTLGWTSRTGAGYDGRSDLKVNWSARGGETAGEVGGGGGEERGERGEGA